MCGRIIYMNKKYILIIVVLVILVGGAILYYNIKKIEADYVLYEKQESWGPCPDSEGGCFLNTYLYNSGKIILESKTTREEQLNKELMDKIIQKN